MTKISTSLANRQPTRADGTSGTRRRVLARSAGTNVEPVATPPPAKPSRIDPRIPAASLATSIEHYIETCLVVNRHSARSIENKQDRLGKLLWLCRYKEWEEVGTVELRAFFLYLSTSHSTPEGRWTNPKERTAVSSGTVKTYYSTIRAFFNYLVNEDMLKASPMAKMSPPVDRPDQVQPFTREQITALYRVAGETAYPERDQAILLTMLDTGLRVSELCALVYEDINLNSGEIVIREGKGGKRRVVPISRDTKRALHALQASVPGFLPTDSICISERGRASGEALSRRGVGLLIRRLGQNAGISGVRCSPHTFRHTFAIEFLRAGGNVFTLKHLLGHESLAMTNRYVAVAQADVRAQHQQFSPVEGMKLGRRK